MTVNTSPTACFARPLSLGAPRAHLSKLHSNHRCSRVTPSATIASEDATVEIHVNPTESKNGVYHANDAAQEKWSRIAARAGSSTLSVHGGERVRTVKHNKAVLDAIATPVVSTSTFTFKNTADCIAYNRGKYESFEYGRYGNPTTRAAELKLAALEGADDALLSSSGMNAVTTMLLALVPPGGHVILTTDCYRRTRQFARTVLPNMKIRTTVIDPADMKGLEDALNSPGGADLYFSEAPTNPLVRVVDTPAISALCREKGTICVIDTTFATPYNYRPISDGADIVLHSASKYLGGHHDVLAGAIAGDAELVERVRKFHGVLGGVIDPHASMLINRGMKTLGMRMAAHNKNAETVAQYLEKHPKISRVWYPTVKSHPDHQVAMRLMPGFGGVLSFEIKGNNDPWSQETFDATGRFVDALNIPYIGPSMGGCESLVEQVCIMGYFDQPLRERKRLGINNGLIRFACGVEDTNDLINDVEQALECV